MNPRRSRLLDPEFLAMIALCLSFLVVFAAFGELEMRQTARAHCETDSECQAATGEEINLRPVSP